MKAKPVNVPSSDCTPEYECEICKGIVATEEPVGARFICDECLSTSEPVIATCSCGKRFTLAQWKELELVGRQPDFDDDGNESATKELELRNCTCLSTRALEVEK